MADLESNVEEIEDMQTHKGSPWGNDEIILSKDDAEGILQGKTYYYFDGEYGHYIHMKKRRKENKTMRIFISVPIKDKTDEEINKEIELCRNAYLNIVKALDVDCNIVFVDNYIPYSQKIASAIAKLLLCDECIFLEGYEKYRGCRIEHYVCEEYNIPTYIAGGEDNHSYIEREMPEKEDKEEEFKQSLRKAIVHLHEYYKL